MGAINVAEILTMQDLANGHLDVKALGEAANGDENTIVTTRTGNTYPSAERAINIMFQNGGLPATPFATKAKMETEGASLADGQLAQVYNETTNNGLYVKTAGVWVKAAYDPTEQANAYSDESIATFVGSKIGKNLFDKIKVKADTYIDNMGKIRPNTDWTISQYIPVVAGLKYTVSATTKRVGLAFYANFGDVDAIASSYNGANTPVTVIAPTGANYLVINVNSNIVVASNVQVEQNSVATAYAPYTEQKEIFKSVLPDDAVYTAELQAAIADINTAKDYEVELQSKNLFDESKIRVGKLLTSPSGAVGSIANWAMSDYIPVVAGESYTLSGTRSRLGLSFFATNVDGETPISYTDSIAMPLTWTAPVGANFVAFNVYTATTQGQYSNLMLERGAIATTYTPYFNGVGIDSSYIINADASKYPTFEVFANNEATLKASSDVDITLNMRLYGAITHDNSSLFNFLSGTFDNTRMEYMGDDVAPIRIDGTTVGANHGYAKTTITSAGHGKTNADVGSIWSDGAAQFVIIDIVSVDKISVTARTSNVGLTANSLTHVSGATNTAAINTTTKTTNQLFPVIKNHNLTVMVDGYKIDTSNPRLYSYKKELAIHESYEIMSKSDIAEWIILNRGKSLPQYDAAASVLYNTSHVFDKDGGCVVYTSVTAYKSVPFQDYMGTQSFRFGGTERKYYVPKSIPFVSDLVSYDFTQLQPMANYFTTPIFFTSARNEVGANPVDRLIQFSSDVGFATGYLPLLDAKPSERLTNASRKYLEIRGDSLKVYPMLVDNAAKTTLEAGDSYAAIAYRKYFRRDSNRTAKYVVRSNIADFLYLDWHSAKMDVIELDDDLIGRSFTVHEKSSNVTILSKFATNNVAVKIDSSKSYGYLVLRFDK